MLLQLCCDLSAGLCPLFWRGDKSRLPARSRRAEPVPPHGAGVVTHGGRGGLPGRGRRVDVAVRCHDGCAALNGSRERSPITMGDKLLNYLLFNLGLGKRNQSC